MKKILTGFLKRMLNTISFTTKAYANPVSGDTTPPQILLPNVKDNVLWLLYSEPLDPTSVPAGSDFTVWRGYFTTQVPVLNVTIADNIVFLTLAVTFNAGDLIYASYTPGSIPIRDLAGNNVTIAFNNQYGFNSTGGSSPLLLTYPAVNGNVMQVTYHKPLDITSVPAGSAFTITVNGIAQAAPTHVSIAGSIVTLTLAAVVKAGDIITTSYTPGSNPIRYAVGYNAGPLGGMLTINSTVADNSPPVLSEAVVTEATLQLIYDEPLDTISVPVGNDFVVKVNGTAQTVPVNITVADISVTLTLASAVKPGDIVTISYTSGSNPIRDMAGNNVAAFTDQAVTNQTVDTIITTAGSGAGDGGPGTWAQMGPANIAIGPDGSVYIADAANHRIRRVSSGGTITTVAGNGTGSYSGDGGPATQAQLNAPKAVAVGADGSLYIADKGNHAIRRVGPNGTITTVAGNGAAGYSGDGGPAAAALLNYPESIVLSADGSLYIADRGNNAIRRIESSGTIATIAGNGAYGYSGDGELATAARLSYPAGVAVATDGSLYIVDTGNHCLRRVDPDGTITTVAGNGIVGYGGDGGPATAAQLNCPESVVLGADGSLYTADRGNNAIRRIGPDGTITTVAGNGTYGYSGDGGPATAAQLSYPTGVAPAADGSLYIADNSRIRLVNAAGTITTVVGNGDYWFSGDGGTGSAAGFNQPSGITVATDGSLYIVDAGNSRIRRIGADGIITTVAGNGDYWSSGDGGLAIAAGFDQPAAVAAGPDGSLYIAEKGNHCIRRVGADGVITTIAGNGLWGYSGDGGPATAAQLYAPTGIAVGTDGSLYIADTGNHCLRRVGTDGVITTIAGNGVWGYSGDGGSAAAARLYAPAGIAVSMDGSLYIADAGNYCVRRIGSDGVIITVAGNGTLGYSGDGGQALQAQIDPAAIAVGPDGSLYITESGNNRLRRVGADGTITTVAGNGVCGYRGDGNAATAAQLNAPAGVAVAADGSLYIADTGSNFIRQVV